MGRLKEKWFKRRFGIRLGRGSENCLTSLRFADDVLLLGASLKQVKEMLSDLVDAAAEIGLEIHKGKTKIINNGYGHAQNIRQVRVKELDIEVLPRSESTMYLGRLLKLTDSQDTELQNRIALSWRKFGAHRGVLCDKGYPLNQRLRSFNTVITPTVLYGSSSWTMTAAREQALRTAQRKMLRSILGKGRQREQRSEDNSSMCTDGTEDAQETE
jgi:hypothetical protein